MKKLESLTIFFPCFNDGKIMPTLIKKAYGVGSKIASDFEVMVIDDGSEDYTLGVLKQLKGRYKNLRIVYHKKNRGYGGALTSGFKNAKKKWVFYTDGDGQYDPTELVLLVKNLKPDIDVVNGIKRERRDNIVRIIVGGLNNWVLHRVFDLSISDIDCDFRLMRKSLLDRIELTSMSGTICLELVVKLQKVRAHFAEVRVHHYKRPYGSSQFFKLGRVAKTVRDNIRFYFSQSSNIF